MDDEQELEDGFDENTETGEESGSGEAAPPKAKTESKDSGTSDKRVNDLMGNWQKEQARANRLESELAELKKVQTGNGGTAEQTSQDASQANEFLELAREQARQSLYASEPRFAALGIEVTAIEGTSAKEMQASFSKLRGLIDKVEGSTRTQVLREHGMDPEISGGGSDKKRDFASMTDEEILAL